MSGSKPNAPSAPVLPQVQPFTSEELAAFKKANMSLDQANELLSERGRGLEENQAVLRSFSGLYDVNGDLDQEKINDLASRVQSRLDLRSQIGEDALGYLGSVFDGDDNAEMSDLIRQRYLTALKGEGPVSERLQTETKDAFRLAKESAARRGIKIEGSSLEEAATMPQESSAAGRMVKDLASRYDMAAQDERNFELTQGLSSLGYLDNVRTRDINFAMALSQGADADATGALGYYQGALSSSPYSLFSDYGQLAQSQLGMAQPYQNQRFAILDQQTRQSMANYEAAYAKYQGKVADRNQKMQGFGQMGGMGAMALMMNPATMPYGLALMAAMGGAGALS